LELILISLVNFGDATGKKNKIEYVLLFEWNKNKIISWKIESYLFDSSV
jgi:hypothetical protein